MHLQLCFQYKISTAFAFTFVQNAFVNSSVLLCGTHISWILWCSNIFFFKKLKEVFITLIIGENNVKMQHILQKCIIHIIMYTVHFRVHKQFLFTLR
jgi:hypothetical protein